MIGTLNVSLQPGKSGDHRHCGSGDIMVLLCYVILKYHVTKGLSNVGVLKVCQHSAKFGGHKHCGSRDIMALVC